MKNTIDIQPYQLSIDDPRFRITPTQQMAAACSGALITSIIVTPLDVVKIRLQAQQKTLVSNKCFLYCNGLMDHLCTCPANENNAHEYWYKRPSHFNGTVDALVKISRTEGIWSLWSGLSPTLVLALPATVVYFVTYEQLRTRLADWAKKETTSDSQPLWAPLVAGCTARLWAATLVSPLELVRTKMQSKRLSYLEIRQALQSLLKHRGLPGLWTGLGPTLLRDVPFSGIYWITYEKFKMLNNNNSTFLYSFVGGSIAGTLAAVLTTPFDVVKTHRQIEIVEKEIIAESPAAAESTYRALKNIYQKNGFSGLFAGIIPRIIRIAPACAIMVASFEYGKSFFQKYNKTQFEEEFFIKGGGHH
uniref:Putative mitochondrial carrier protein cgi-69 n=1 Tax=Panstrongylus lignarius TaxID=156445 RepID=A0A224XS71_9HEMI